METRTDAQTPARHRPGQFDRRLAWLAVGVSAMARVARSRQFQAQVIVGAIVLTAMARNTWEKQMNAMARLAEWERRHGLRD